MLASGLFCVVLARVFLKREFSRCCLPQSSSASGQVCIVFRATARASVVVVVASGSVALCYFSGGGGIFLAGCPPCSVLRGFHVALILASGWRSFVWRSVLLPLCMCVSEVSRGRRCLWRRCSVGLLR